MSLLSDEEIMVINQTAEFDSAIGYARKIESAILDKLQQVTALKAHIRSQEEHQTRHGGYDPNEI